MPKLIKLGLKYPLGDQIFVKCTFKLDCQAAIVLNRRCAVHEYTCTQTHNTDWLHSFKAISVDTQCCLFKKLCVMWYLFSNAVIFGT